MFADYIVKIFGFGFSETNALHLFLDTLAKIFSQANFNKFISSVLVLVECFCTFMFGMPTTPRGEALDLTGYECVFVDEFEGDELNTDVWFHRAEGSRRCGFNTSDAVRVENGNLIIKQLYDENGKFGPGWYAGMIALKQKYLRGYFEIKCICNDDPDFWSAFWIQADAPYTPEISKGGIGGCEIDIFESLNNGNIWRNDSVSLNIHCSGMEGDTSGELNSLGLGSYKGKDIYNSYNTYGLKWTEEEYIFYINGVEAVRSSFADGVSQVPEQVIISLEIPGTAPEDKSKTSEFIVDYIKIYQKQDEVGA